MLSRHALSGWAETIRKVAFRRRWLGVALLVASLAAWQAFSAGGQRAPLPARQSDDKEKVQDSPPERSEEVDKANGFRLFGEYEVPLYKGRIHPPKWIRKGDGWRDQFGKLVDELQVNFAGKYFIAVHSCGTGCRYYTLTDLSSGRDLDILNMFASADPPPRTPDGFEYLTMLAGRYDSRLLVAQDHVRLAPDREECRERVFELENERLIVVSNSPSRCRQFE